MQVEAKYRRMKQEADQAHIFSQEWQEKCNKVTNLCR